MMIVTCFAFSCLLLAWEGSTSIVEGEIERFEREYPNAATQNESIHNHINGYCQIVGRDPSSSNGETKDTAVFAHDHGIRKVEIRWGDSGDSSIYVINDNAKSSFLLRQIGGRAGYRIDPPIPDHEVFVSRYNMVFGKYINSPYSIFGYPLVTLMERPDFEVISAESRQEGGRTLVEVECLFGETLPKSRLFVVFDPESGWTIQNSKLWPGGVQQNEIHTTITYGPERDGRVFPNVVEITDAASGQWSRCEFREIRSDRTPEEAFSLSHYGLGVVDRPKPATPTRRLNLTAWLLGAGIVGLIVSAVIGRMGAARWGS